MGGATRRDGSSVALDARQLAEPHIEASGPENGGSIAEIPVNLVCLLGFFSLCHPDV
jgi:hypothetical protein